MRAQEALRAGQARLAEAGVPEAGRDARLLLAHALGIAPDRLVLALPEPMPGGGAERFEAALAARARRVPVSHITGRRAFWGRDFAVTPDVLDPRPETETLIAAALEAPFRAVLDLGTGSGAIVVTLLAERPAAQGLGTDLSEAALAVARRNAAAHAPRARFLRSDWFAAVEGRFDLIVSNPPYIAEHEMAGLSPEVLREPRMALTPGGDGLDAYRALAAGARGHLEAGGRMLLEIGPTQGAAVAGLLAAQGFEAVAVLPDLDGRDRVVTGRAPR